MTNPLGTVVVTRIRLQNPDEDLHRQIIPLKHWQYGRLTSSIFKTQQASVDRGSMTTGEAAFQRATAALTLCGKPIPMGFCSISLLQCQKAGATQQPPLDIPVYEDPETHDRDTGEEFGPDDPRRNPAHAFIEMSTLKRGELERVSKELSRCAAERVTLLVTDPTITP